MALGSLLAQARREAQTAVLAEIDVSRAERFKTETHWPFFARLRRDDPMHYCADSAHGPYWSITLHQDIIAVEKDHDHFSSAGNVIIGDVPPEFDAPAFATADPPVHTIERKAVMPALAPQRLARLEGEMRREVQAILDDLPRGETFDWVERVSKELTTRMVATLFNFPRAERRLLPHWAEVLVTTPGPGAITSDWAERKAILDAYLERILAMWRARIGESAGDDILSMLANNPDTASMTEDPQHLIGTVTLIAGANEAARGALSGGVVAFDRFPDEWRKLRADPSLLANAIPEIVRWQSPITHMRRTAKEDVEFRGKHIRKGERVVMWYCSGNRDEVVFDNADVFHVERPNAHRHASYGFGIHRCLGRHVADKELRILWEEILKRFDRIEVAAPPERIASNFSANYARLTVRIPGS
jgi:cytochrome P450